MRALVIAPQPFFSPRGTPLSVYLRTLVTAELGVEVDLLTYGQGQDVDIPGVRIVRIPKFGYLGDVRVGPSYLKLLLDIVLLFRMVRLLLARKYDFVHAHEEAVFFALLLKPLFRFALVYDMHSSLPRQLTSFQFTRSKLLVGLFEKLEDAALRSADMVIVICEDLYRHAAEKMRDARRLILIENSLFDPVRLSKSGGGGAPGAWPAVPVGKRLVVYAGTLEPYQGIDLALEAFREVVRRRSDVCFLIAGGDTRQVRHYSDMAAALGIAEHCRFTGVVPKAQAGAYVRSASVLVSPRITGTNTPLKVYEQLASGIPLVATRIYSHTQVLTEEAAFLVDPDPDAMAAGMLEALESKQACEVKVRNARQLYKQKYSRQIYRQKMEQVLEAVR